MRKVNTKSELANAIKAGEEHIICGGAIADMLLQKYHKSSKSSVSFKRHNNKKILLASFLCVASIAAAPFTAGASLGMGAVIGGGTLAGTAALISLGTIATGLTAGPITMTAKELMVICGTFLTSKALDKLYEIHFSDGKYELDAKPTTK